MQREGSSVLSSVEGPATQSAICNNPRIYTGVDN